MVERLDAEMAHLRRDDEIGRVVSQVRTCQRLGNHEERRGDNFDGPGAEHSAGAHRQRGRTTEGVPKWNTFFMLKSTHQRDKK